MQRALIIWFLKSLNCLVNIKTLRAALAFSLSISSHPPAWKKAGKFPGCPPSAPQSWVTGVMPSCVPQSTQQDVTQDSEMWVSFQGDVSGRAPGEVCISSSGTLGKTDLGSPVSQRGVPRCFTATHRVVRYPLSWRHGGSWKFHWLWEAVVPLASVAENKTATRHKK
jgi:hypothetical protein